MVVRYKRLAPKVKLTTAQQSAVALSKVNRLSKYVRKLKPELKHRQYAVQTDNYDNGGTMLYLSGLTQADGESSRDGNQVSHQRTEIRGQVALNPSTAVESQMIRVIVWKWTADGAGAMPTSDQILEAADPLSGYSFTNHHNFVVLKDRTFSLDTYNPSKTFKFVINRKFPILYDGTTNGITSSSKNNIFMFVISDQATNYPSLSYINVMRYYDA